MPRDKTATFRDQTTGLINDLMIDEDEACAPSQNLIIHLAGALLNYRHEGVEFTPSIVLCDDVDGFLRSFPGSVHHVIGSGPLDSAFGPKILKDCAPLSSSNWFIFIQRVEQKSVVYGVFTYFRLPTSISLHEGITLNQGRFCVLVRKVSPTTIEIRGARGSIATLIFSTDRESESGEKFIQKFAIACCRGLDANDINKEFGVYFVRLLEALLRSSHGTIFVCVSDIDLASITEMQDAVAVNPSLDFRAAFSEFKAAQSAEAILNLQRCEELLEGFLQCDGMIAFDTHGRVTAYRVFFRPTLNSAIKPDVVGGARRRAFEGMKALIGPQILSVLFRSQDGLTLEYGVEK
jgi:hypothetical protein